jgi:hypothetical protein
LFDLDTELLEVAQRSTDEPNDCCLALVSEYLDVANATGIVDEHMCELPARIDRVVLPITRDTMTRRNESTELLGLPGSARS